MAIDIADVPRAQRYEMRDGDALLGWVDYRLEGHVRSLVHARVLPEARHHGLATRMVRSLLDDIEVRGEQVLPLCSFVQWVIERHPEYRMLVPRDAPAAMCPWLGVNPDAE